MLIFIEISDVFEKIGCYFRLQEKFNFEYVL